MDMGGAVYADNQGQVSSEVTSEAKVVSTDAYDPLQDAKLCAELGVSVIEWD